VLMVFPEIATFLPIHASYQTCQEFWIAKRNVNNIQMIVSAIHPFCKYAPKNDRLSGQIYNKFS
jgi:hypothetical protein